MTASHRPGMAKARKVALGLAFAVLVLCLALCATGLLAPMYLWLVRYMQPGVWSALAGCVTAIVAVVAAIFAWSQVKLARETREEIAQPNVVLYTEPSSATMQILEIVLKNFGSTPAYNVKVTVNPPIKARPNSPGEDVVDIPFPAA
jgi:hypothetical protein